MYRALLLNPAIEKYLRVFPKPQWDKCVELTVMLGIQTAMTLMPSSLSLESLVRAVETRVPELSGDSVIREKNPNIRDQYDKVDSSRLPLGTERKKTEKSLVSEQMPGSRHKHKEDICRFFSPQKVASAAEDAQVHASEVRKKHLSPSPSESPRYAHRPGSRVSKQPISSAFSSPKKLVEPRTNAAFLGRLADWETPENSVLGITNRFLTDPFLTTLSSRGSPRTSRK